jgi:pimeloyl-ACP methyl ester carboxylesterase
MGGKVAQLVALAPPEALERLVLIAPGSPNAIGVEPKQQEMAAAAYGSREKIERFQRGAMAKTVAPAVMMRLVDDALTASRETWEGWYESGRSADFADRVDAIALPTFVLAGERDPLASPARVKRDVADRIRGSAFVTLKGVGHNLPVEAASEVALLIERVA